MFYYFARLSEKYALPVYPIVIFSYDTPQRSEPTSYQVTFPDKTILEFNYSVIQLNRLHWRDFLRQENPVAAALMAKMQIKPQERSIVKLECLRLLATLRLDPARMQLISGFIDSYLRLNIQEEQLFQTQLSTLGIVQQEEVMEIVTSWMEQGIEQGRQEGKQEGRQEEAQSLILRQLNRRIGAFDAQLQAQIQQLSLSQLENLGEALLDFSDTSDLITWLEQHLSSN
jgi:predicted transposase YdaD